MPTRSSQRQRLQQRRSLAPRAAGDHLVAAPRPPHHRLDGRAVFGEVVHRQIAALLLLEPHDLARDVAAVERIVRRAQSRRAIRAGGAVLVGHVLQRARKVGLDEFVPRLRHPVVGQIDRGVGRPAPIFVLMRRDRGGEQRIHRETLAGVADRIGRDIGEAHRAVALQCGDPGVGCGGDDGAQHAVGDFSPVLAHEDVGGKRLRPPAEAGDALHVAVRQPDHDRCDAGDVHQVGLQHAERYARRAAGVDRVAAGFQDGEGGRGRQIVAGGDGVTRAVDGRAMAHDGLLKERAQACGKASATSRVPGGPQRRA